jgi:hypothetical protein
MTGDGIDLERARCLAVAMECLENGHFGPCSPEFADGYSLACQEIAGGIIRPSEAVDFEDDAA